MGSGTNLYFDEFLDAVGDDKVLGSLGGFSHEHLVAGLEPAAVLVVDECLGVGLFVVQVAEDDGGRLDEELASRLVGGDLVAVCVDELGLGPGQEAARRADEPVGFAGGGYAGRGFCHSCRITSDELMDGGKWLKERGGGFAYRSPGRCSSSDRASGCPQSPLFPEGRRRKTHSARCSGRTWTRCPCG